MLNIKDFGAVADGVTINTKSIQAAIDAAGETNEIVLIPAGVFRTGSLNLHGVSMHLESGAVLKGSEDMEDYPPQAFVHNELGALRALLFNIGHDNVTIDGSGTIDFSGKSFYDTSVMNVPESRVPYNEEQIAECTYRIGTRPSQCLFFHDSKNIVLKGIRLIDAPCWTVSFNECENVQVIGLTIDTDLNVPNDDGIHFCSCKGVLVSGCNISSGDDCIAVTCITNWAKPCEDVVIRDCVLHSCSKTISIGYIWSVVRNVQITNCIITDSHRGICIMGNDEGALVENVRVTNCIIDTHIRAGNWWGNGEPILLMALKHDYARPVEENPHNQTDCIFRNITFDGVTCIGENAIGIYGTEDRVREVTLRNVDFSRKPSGNLALKGSRFDFAPGTVEFDIPEDCGLYISRDAEVELDNVNTRQWKVIVE